MATTTDFFRVIFGAEDELSGPMATIAGNAAKLLGGFLAIQQLGDFLKDSLQSAIESERAWAKLGAAVERHGGIWETTRGQFEAFASSLQISTGISDEAIAESMQLFIDYGASGEQAMQRVRIAADLAAGANISLESAVQLLAKASAGATEMLGRYGIRVDENLSKSEKFQAALDLISERFGGAAARNAETLAGKLAILNEQWDDMKENISGITVGPLTNLISGLNDVLTVVNANIPAWEKLKIAAEIWFSPLAGVGAPLVLSDALSRIEKEASRARLPMMSMHETFGMVQERATTTAPKIDDVSDAIAKLIETNDAWNVSFQNAPFDDWLKRDPAAELERIIAANDAFNQALQPNEMDWLKGPSIDESLQQTLQRARQHQEEWQQFAIGSTGRVTSEIAGMFVGLEGDLKGVFRNIARDWIAMVLNDILKQTALRLGAQLFGLLFPAQGSILSAAAGGVTGGITGAGKRSPLQVGGASVMVNIGQVIGQEEYIAEYVTPVIVRGAEYGLNRLALQEPL